MAEVAGTTKTYGWTGLTCSSAGVSDRYGISSRSTSGMVASAELENGEPMTAVDVALELVEGEHGLVGLALVVLDDQLDLAAEHAAGVVDLLDGELDGLLVLAAERRVVAGQRHDLADLDRAVVAGAVGGVVAAGGGGQRRG